MEPHESKSNIQMAIWLFRTLGKDVAFTAICGGMSTVAEILNDIEFLFTDFYAR